VKQLSSVINHLISVRVRYSNACTISVDGTVPLHVLVMFFKRVF
jgi:hypothetical protein